MRDPVVLLLDEPTWDLDPLNTYFVISILANHAKKVGFTLICLNGRALLYHTIDFLII